MTWHLPTRSDADYRKDINPGHEGTIEGFTDEKKSVVLLKLVVNMQGKKIEAVHSVNPGNLQLTKDFQNSKNLSVEAKAAPAKAKGKRVPDWLPGDSESEAVEIEVNWQKLLADTDETNQTFWLKSRIGICLEALAATVPKFTEKDLLFATGGTTKGFGRMSCGPRDPLDLKSWCSHLWSISSGPHT